MVLNGIDRIDTDCRLFQGKRLGMVTSVCAVTQSQVPSYIAFHKRFPLRYLFSPEHGLHARFGNYEEVREDPIEPHTGAGLISLYGGWSARSIPAHALQELDAVVYDIQDLGTRFYTYIATLIRVMSDCAGAGKELIVLDRPALLGGRILEGPLPDPRYHSFVCPWPLPIRYALTAGELARMVNDEKKLGCRLHVVPCEGWKRGDMFPDYGNQWVSPSGAIGDFETALLYPGMCLFEGTNLSEGRGTGRPFRLVGAPFVDGPRLCRELEVLSLPGVKFTPESFRPTASKWKDQVCGGISLRITDPAAFRSVPTAVSVLYTLLELYPGMVEFPPSPWSPEPQIRFLSGCASLDSGRPPLQELLTAWERDCEAFRERKTRYHIYQ